VKFWQAKATGPDGAVMTFGLEAADQENAVELAVARMPFPSSPENITVTEIPPRAERRSR
jgi:hypothetical protein